MTSEPAADDLALLDRHRALVQVHTDRLVATASALDDGSGASLCEGWTRGHVLSHVARNAEAIGRLASWATTGERQEMYPGGPEARDGEIEAGAGRGVAALAEDVRATAETLSPALAGLGGALAAAEVEMRGGYRVASVRLPFLRLREVVFHHVDLDAGFTFEDVEPDLLREFVDDAVGRLGLGSRPPAVTLRAHEGGDWSVGEATTTVTGSLAGLVLWLARRTPTGVVSDAGVVPELPRGA